jgi:hypothetical protein
MYGKEGRIDGKKESAGLKRLGRWTEGVRRMEEKKGKEGKIKRRN